VRTAASRRSSVLSIRVSRPVTAARLIGSTSASTRRFAVLSAGSVRGVRAGQPVRSAAGLIGRVIEAGANTARVLLVTDPENVVPVRRARDGLPAFIEGKSDGRIAIRLINMGVNPLKGGMFSSHPARAGSIHRVSRSQW